MTLEEYQKKKSAGLPPPPARTRPLAGSTSASSSGASTPAQPKVLKIGGGDTGSGASTPPPAQPKTLKIGGEAAQPKANKVGGNDKKEQIETAQLKVEDKKATEQPKSEDKLASEQPKAGESSKAPSEAPSAGVSATPSGTATPKQDAEALAKQQEAELDKEVLTDMFGAGKDHMSIMFMGHVDAGKSTMGGNLLYLTGSVDKRTVEKYEREAKDAGRQGWYLSWVMDTNKEERDQGKTVEVGRATFETDKRRYTILDAPGHKMYVPAMIGGASQADVGILVISARKGEYETGFERGGQTREHAILAKTQGVNRLIVVINKMDDPTVEWSKERYDECTNKLSLFLKGTGYNIKTDVFFMPVSGYTGAGLKNRVPQDKAPWYDGPSLLEYLDDLRLEDRNVNAPFMLPVSGKGRDLGTIVEGKIESGNVRKGQPLILMPNKIPVEVTTVYNETEAEVNGALSGEQVRLKLKGVEEEDVQIGNVLTSAKAPVRTATKFEAQVAIVELKSILATGYSCVMHVHTAIQEVTFTALLHKLEKGTNRKSKKAPAFAKKGMKVIAVLETPVPVCIEPYDQYPQLGRFTLRDQGVTVAIGKVTKLLE
jgi:peptide chain release factor subunit 3